ncbi:hypothetical protein Trco_003002 [Trichoderma cornu-damae]|uniref:Uncharacterized protein n=1 Tax=Trichoderma cornu-damae TaxID=654480 RepID=A0A9P8QNS2_9HYPO|nr:hypothetical protein Trco_003002 [Trichoderma cornu-damae]
MQSHLQIDRRARKMSQLLLLALFTAAGLSARKAVADRAPPTEENARGGAEAQQQQQLGPLPNRAFGATDGLQRADPGMKKGGSLQSCRIKERSLGQGLR